MDANNFENHLCSVEPTLAYWQKTGLELPSLPDFIYEIDQILRKMIEVSKIEILGDLNKVKQEVLNMIEEVLKPHTKLFDNAMFNKILDIYSDQPSTSKYERSNPSSKSFELVLPKPYSQHQTTGTSVSVKTTAAKAAAKWEHPKTILSIDQSSTSKYQRCNPSSQSVELVLSKPYLQHQTVTSTRTMAISTRTTTTSKLDTSPISFDWNDLNNLVPSEGSEPIMNLPDLIPENPRIVTQKTTKSRPQSARNPISQTLIYLHLALTVGQPQKHLYSQLPRNQILIYHHLSLTKCQPLQ